MYLVEETKLNLMLEEKLKKKGFAFFLAVECDRPVAILLRRRIASIQSISQTESRRGSLKRSCAVHRTLLEATDEPKYCQAGRRLAKEHGRPAKWRLVIATSRPRGPFRPH
jgi:hypothetical protein